MEGKEGLQEEFFHTFNSLHGAGRQIILSSDRRQEISQHWKIDCAAVLSGVNYRYQPPDVETRLAILRKKLKLRAVKFQMRRWNLLQS